MSVPASAQRAAIYLRVSKAEQLDGYSPEGMERACREKAEALGADVVAFFLEDGPGDDWDLPLIWEAIGLAERGGIDVVISYDTSRVARDMGKRLWIKRELGKHGVGLAYATVEFAATPEGELHENFLGIFDQYERAKIRARTQNGIRTKLARGEVMGCGRTPYALARVHDKQGRTIGYVPTEPGAGTLKRIVGLLRTETLVEVCRRLNAEGVPTPSGTGRWQPGGIRSLLRKPVYLGTYEFGRSSRKRRGGGKTVYLRRADDAVTTIPVEPILTRAELDAARAALDRRKRDRRPRRTEADDPYTLRGMLSCEYCGGALSCQISKGVRYYQCLRSTARGDARCPLPIVRADHLEAHVWSELRAKLDDLDAVRAALDDACDASEAARRYVGQLAALDGEIKRLETRIDRATEDLYAAERGSRVETYARNARAAAERELREIERSRAELARAEPSWLTRDAADALFETFCVVVNGLEESDEDPAEQRALYREARLAVVVGLAEDGHGVRCGRRHAFRVGWASAVGLGGGTDSGNDPQGSFTLSVSSTHPPALLRPPLARVG
jgi:site-specific DNA recombinase